MDRLSKETRSAQVQGPQEDQLQPVGDGSARHGGRHPAGQAESALVPGRDGSLPLLGLAWIVVYYMAGESVPLMSSLGSWNFAVGFAFLVVGLGMAVRWR